MKKSSKDVDKARNAPAGMSKKSLPTTEQQHIEEMLDEASMDSFPASDPPSWISHGLEDAVAAAAAKRAKKG